MVVQILQILAADTRISTDLTRGRKALAGWSTSMGPDPRLW
jgi:hypothetical protein